MTIRRRRTTVAALLAGGAGAVAIGAVIAVDRALHLIGVLLVPLWEIVTRWVTGEVATPAPPAFFWPALGLIVGIAILAAGWVAVIRGVTLGWSERFDRTRRSLDTE